MQQNSERDNSLKTTVNFLRATKPLAAEEQCRQFLTLTPGCTAHLRLLAHALLMQKKIDDAREQLELAISIDPNSPHLHEDIGGVFFTQNDFEQAIVHYKKAAQLDPSLPLIHKKLGQALAATGKSQEADTAFESYLEQDENRAAVIKGIELAHKGKTDEAKTTFQNVIKNDPENINALLQLGLIYWQHDEKLDDAQALLTRATQIDPNFADAWYGIGGILMNKHKPLEAIDAYQKVTTLKPDNAEAWGGLGGALGRAMQPEKSIAAYEKALALNPQSPTLNSGYAYELKTMGNQEAALSAYRTAITNAPAFGEVYWSMANLKIFNFEEQEIRQMKEQLDNKKLSESAEIHIRFALGKAMEDQKQYDEAWHYYDTGNEKQRMTVEHDPVLMENRFDDIKENFNKTYFINSSKKGHDSPAPIFIVGLPRSGSTLIEQIFSSHSQVEGTSELPIIGQIVDSIGRYRPDNVLYPKAAAELSDKDLASYGKQYIEESRLYRETNKPFFTDKLPNNFPHIGFIHSILPNAKFINARRHPLDSCLGAYKQLFGSGQNFTYDQFDLAHYYEQYDAIMNHWHDVLPGKILNVDYEETVTNLEQQVRNILNHCNLEFENNCLEYYKNDRAVKTASSEQVRQPIYTSGLGKWRRYDAHLDFWKEELKEIIESRSDVVKNAGL